MRVSRKARGRHWKSAGSVVLALTALIATPMFAGGASAATGNGWLRLGHFALATGEIDEYMDGAIQAKALSYTQVTAYTPVAAGAHSIAVRVAGAPSGSAPLATITVTVATGTASTVAVDAGASGLTAQVYQDDLTAPPTGTAKVRVIHALGAIPAVNVYVSPTPASSPAAATAVESRVAVALPATTPAFNGLAFGAASQYADVPSGNYEVELQAAGTGKVVVTAHNWPVAPSTVASVVVLQGAGGPTLEVLRDAVGATTTPVGAMATGAGGMAHRYQDAGPAALRVIVGLTGVAVLAIAVNRRRLPTLSFVRRPNAS